jgi:Ribonucleotide reductase, barrel domain
MATGHAYDFEGGRALAAAITSLVTGAAYRRSAELAGVVGPYDGYARDASAHQRVMRKHAAANDAVRPVGADDGRILRAATWEWQECLRIGAENGWRNAQASLLAPTGCLTADTLVMFESLWGWSCPSHLHPPASPTYPGSGAGTRAVLAEPTRPRHPASGDPSTPPRSSPPAPSPLTTSTAGHTESRSRRTDSAGTSYTP